MSWWTSRELRARLPRGWDGWLDSPTNPRTGRLGDQWVYVATDGQRRIEDENPLHLVEMATESSKNPAHWPPVEQGDEE